MEKEKEIIPKNIWETCKICNIKVNTLKVPNTRGLRSRADVFRRHLKEEHNITPLEYFSGMIPEKYCLCGCGKKVDIVTRGSDFIRHQRLPNHPDVVTKQHQSEAAKKRKHHGHTGIHHSEETKQKLRIATLKQFEKGDMPQSNTLPNNAFADLLVKNGIEFVKEKRISLYSFDFYLPIFNVYVEIDGDYWHSNPKFYPNGPINAAQRKNFARDCEKNDFVKMQNLVLLRFWEDDIINNKEFVEQTLLEKLNVYKS